MVIANTFNGICGKTEAFRLVLMSMSADIGVGVATRQIFAHMAKGEKMSVLIKGMEMPTQCYDCYLIAVDPDKDGLYCKHLKKDVNDWSSRLDDCPLVEVPTPHGDLIDREEAMKGLHTIFILEKGHSHRCIQPECVEFAPTVIEAEG